MLSLMLLPLPAFFAPATVLPADSPVSAANSPLPLPTFAIDSLLICAYDHSTYPIEPADLGIAAATPSEPFSAWPPGAFQTLSLPNDQSLFAVDARNLVKLSVVPDDSCRWIARIGVDGREAFGLSALISAASQVLTVPAKILAIVAGLSWRSVTPLRLNATAIGPVTIGRSIALPSLQRASALGCSSASLS